MEDSSERLFFKIVNTIYDNSTGDMNYIPFSFIDKMRLNKLFEEYLINEFGEQAESEGYLDGQFSEFNADRWKKIPDLLRYYNKGYANGLLEFNKKK